MNIFVLSHSPILAAEYQCDSHVVKMTLESAQLLSTAHRVLDGELYIDDSTGRKIKRWSHPENRLYKATHVNHPCAIWVRESKDNYCWLLSHFIFLLQEYTYRFGKVHKCSELQLILNNAPQNIHQRGLTDHPKCTNGLDLGDTISTYRAYYLSKNIKMVWSKRKAPKWFISPSKQ